MSSSRLGGALSPLPPRSSAPSPSRQKFPGDTLRPHMRTILSSTLYGLEWDPSNKTRMSQVSKQVSEKVKAKMLELVPRGFKYIVTVTLSENLGQAGRADMTCHWEDTDSAIQEMFSNDSIIFVCVAFAVRVI